jgi:hypothetical protein
MFKANNLKAERFRTEIERPPICGQLFAEILHINARCFIQFKRIKANAIGKLWRQLIPYTNHQVFYGTDFALHKLYIYIQIFVVELFYDKFLDDDTQFFYIENKTGVRTGIAAKGYVKLKIMPMPVFIGTFAKNGFILGFAPVGVE